MEAPKRRTFHGWGNQNIDKIFILRFNTHLQDWCSCIRQSRFVFQDLRLRSLWWNCLIWIHNRNQLGWNIQRHFCFLLRWYVLQHLQLLLRLHVVVQPCTCRTKRKLQWTKKIFIKIQISLKLILFLTFIFIFIFCVCLSQLRKRIWQWSLEQPRVFIVNFRIEMLNEFRVA